MDLDFMTLNLLAIAALVVAHFAKIVYNRWHRTGW